MEDEVPHFFNIHVPFHAEQFRSEFKPRELDFFFLSSNRNANKLSRPQIRSDSGRGKLHKALSLWMVIIVLGSVLGASAASAQIMDQTTNEKPSLAEANPLLMVVLVLGGLVGVVLSALALRALWRGRQYEE
jgi:hypothetical protein